MGENLGPAIGEDQRQLTRKPLPLVQDLRSVVFFLFLMVREFHRAPVGNMPGVAAAKYVEHSSGTEQTDVPAMQGLKRPTSIVTERNPISANLSTWARISDCS